MPDFAYPCLAESISAAMPLSLPDGYAPNFVFTLRDMDVSQPDEPPVPSALPPGSICETCWDQPATQLLPAPWGGEMGVCVWCGKGEGEDAQGAEHVTCLSPNNAPVASQFAAPGLMVSRYSSDGVVWHEHITDCIAGVRYVSAVYVPVNAS